MRKIKKFKRKIEFRKKKKKVDEFVILGNEGKFEQTIPKWINLFVDGWNVSSNLRKIFHHDWLLLTKLRLFLYLYKSNFICIHRSNTWKLNSITNEHDNETTFFLTHHHQAILDEFIIGISWRNESKQWLYLPRDKEKKKKLFFF